MNDQYDNAISTSSPEARDYYVDGVDCVLAGQVGIVDAFESAVMADPGFALGYAGLARGHQFSGNLPGAKVALQKARELNHGLDAREQSHLHALGLLLDGKGAEAYLAIRAHVDNYPRDALIAQTCSSVFGLIGFSGKPGREAEMLAYNAALLPHYGEDWWCLSQYAFALCETGNLDKASNVIDQSLALNPLNANAAHVRSHVYYEAGETKLGIDFLMNWLDPYDRGGYLHGHLSWHTALWSLELGDVDDMWHRLKTDIQPGVSQGLPINVLTDTASLLWRAELAGVLVADAYWSEISKYAQQLFPKTTLGFVDFHAALAHAMAGEVEALENIIESPNPLTGELVTAIARAYQAIAQQHWEEAIHLLTSSMADHARLGGSRAQRDILEYSLIGALFRLSRSDEAKRLLMLRRPALADTKSLRGLNVH